MQGRGVGSGADNARETDPLRATAWLVPRVSRAGGVDYALLDANSFLLAGVAIPLMAAGTAAGRLLNERVGERGFAVLFWSVMTGYSIRIVTVII